MLGALDKEYYLGFGRGIFRVIVEEASDFICYNAQEI